MFENVRAFDTETTGLDRFNPQHEIFSYSLCDKEGRTSVHRLDGVPFRQKMNSAKLQKLWEDTSIIKSIHHAKFDVGMTEKFIKRHIKSSEFHCTYLMAHVLRNNHYSNGLDDLCWELAGYPKVDDKAIHPYTKGGGNYKHAPEHLMTRYQIADGQRGEILTSLFLPKIYGNANFAEIYESERDLVPVTLRMEERGVMLNRDRCYWLYAKLERDREAVLDEIQSITGERAEPKGDKLIWYLYKHFGLPVIKKTSSGKKSSTDKDTIHQLQEEHPHRFLDLILMFRSWERGMSFIKSYLDKADSNDVLHPQINTCKAITARESCENPNLQNVEKDRAVKNPFPVPMRLCFRPRPGYVNFHVDYSGIEMRLIVHYCGEEILTKILNEGGDVHDPATNIFWGEAYRNGDKDTRKALRDCAKNGSFCIAYGGAIPKLATVLGLSIADTAPKYRMFKMILPRVANLMQETLREVKRNGKIITAFGRYLHIPRDQAYMGTSYLMQGTAAEILKRAQVRVHDYLIKATGGEMKILLPIHDELIIECPRKYLKDAKPVLRHCSKLMTEFPGRFRVPLAVEFKVATTDWTHKAVFSLVG